METFLEELKAMNISTQSLETDDRELFILYSDKDKSELIRMADSKEEMKEITKEHTLGCWYKYNMVKGTDNSYLEDSEKRLRIKFPKTISTEETKEEEKHYWSGLGGSKLR